MRLLVVDDDRGITDEIQQAMDVLKLARPVECTIAGDKASALSLVQAGTFDLVVCDRRIPASTEDVLGAADEHGDAVCAAVQSVAPGTPLIVLTGREDHRRVQELLRNTRSADVFGDHVERPMIDFFVKSDLPDCLARITDIACALDALDQIELVASDVPEERPLLRTEQRVLKLYARRRGGTLVRVRPLGGGLSDARTVRVVVEDARGVMRARTVGKIGRLDAVRHEERRYDEHIANLLNVSAFAARVDRIDAGAADVGGLFYTLADGYDQVLLDVALSDPTRAAEVVERLGTLLRPWTNKAPREQVSVADVRRLFVGDEVFRERCVGLLSDLDWRRFEARQVNIRKCPQHGDLHGLNVLVSDVGNPVLIDYGDVGLGTAALDPVVLELSLLFHPNNVLGREPWPSLAQARAWADLPSYIDGARLAPYVKACRSQALANATGPREVYATAYGYAVRQLKYEDTEKKLALAIVESAMCAFDAD